MRNSPSRLKYAPATAGAVGIVAISPRPFAPKAFGSGFFSMMTDSIGGTFESLKSPSVQYFTCGSPSLSGKSSVRP